MIIPFGRSHAANNVVGAPLPMNTPLLFIRKPSSVRSMPSGANDPVIHRLNVLSGLGLISTHQMPWPSGPLLGSVSPDYIACSTNVYTPGRKVNDL
jgi:hypothetical protein